MTTRTTSAGGSVGPHLCMLLACTAAFAFASCRRADSSLVAAAAEGCLAEVSALLEAGADPNQADPSTPASPLAAAARAGQVETIALLVHRGADPDRPSGRNNWTPLLHAIHKDRPESVRALIAAGADVNRAVGWGFTPLMMAAGNGNLPIVEALLELGADPYARRADGTTALALAVSGGALTDIERPLLGTCHTAVVRALLRRAPDLRLERVRPIEVSRLFAHLNGCDEVLRLTAGQ